jgi:hypothetical protein
MTGTSASGNLEDSLRFATPEEVLTRADLTRKQKIEILKRWEYDAVEADVATEEGMPGKDESPLRRILLALSRLSAGTDVGGTDPSKQHASL